MAFEPQQLPGQWETAVRQVHAGEQTFLVCFVRDRRQPAPVDTHRFLHDERRAVLHERVGNVRHLAVDPKREDKLRGFLIKQLRVVGIRRTPDLVRPLPGRLRIAVGHRDDIQAKLYGPLDIASGMPMPHLDHANAHRSSPFGSIQPPQARATNLIDPVIWLPCAKAVARGLPRGLHRSVLLLPQWLSVALQ